MAKAHVTEKQSDSSYSIKLLPSVVENAINRLLGVLFIVFIVGPLAIRKWCLGVTKLISD